MQGINLLFFDSFSFLYTNLHLHKGHHDYGEIEISLETKIPQVLTQFKSGKVVIVFDQATETCTILKGDNSDLDNL